MLRLRALVVLTLFFALSISLTAQVPGTGLYAFGSYDNRGFDTINVGNLNVHFEIPIVSKTGRGKPFNYSLSYDGLIWSAAGSSGSQYWIPDPSWGFHGLSGEGIMGYVTYDANRLPCTPPRLGFTYTNYTYLDSTGSKHVFNYSVTIPCSGGSSTTGDGSTSDGSGYSFDGTSVHAQDGTILNVPVISGASGGGSYFFGPGSVTDTNGNVISQNGQGVFTDTLGTNALTISGGASHLSPLLFTYNIANQTDGSTHATVTMSYVSYTVQTNFSCQDSSETPIAEYGPAQYDLVDRVTLADGTFYQFTYEPTPGASGTVTGRIASVTLPTGGIISYQYTDGCNGTGINADGTISSLNRIADGTRRYFRAPSTNGSTTDLSDESGNHTLYTFTNVNGVFYETHRKAYQGAISGTPLLEQQTCYNTGVPCDGSYIVLPVSTWLRATTLNGTPQQDITNYYDGPNGLKTRSFVSTPDGTPLQSTDYNYTALGRVYSVIVKDGSGNTISQASYGYDEQAPAATSNLPQHNAVSGPRGNQTSSHVWLNTYNTNIDTAASYDDAGQILSSTDGRSQTTIYSYDPTDTFVTQVAYPIPGNGNNTQIITHAHYDPTSGILLSTTDPNNQTTNNTNYDRLLRPTRIDYPDGGSTTYSFSDVNTFWTDQVIGNGSTSYYVTHRDAYGRLDRTATSNGEAGSNGWNQVDYCYDATGLVHFQSTPYKGTGYSGANATKQCSGSGITYSYDALGRQTGATMPGGGTEQSFYNSNTITKQDEIGHQWQYTVDGLGRTAKVIEPNSAETDYSYGRFTVTVSQKGTGGETPRSDRVFTSDSLGRTVNVSAPESSTTSYSYDNNSNVTSMTDARGVTTNYSYDALNRLTFYSSNDGTPNRIYNYDQTSFWMGPQYNTIGRLSESHTDTDTRYASSVPNPASPYTWTEELYSYDAMGRVARIGSAFPSEAGHDAHEIDMTYDLIGNMTSLRYPDGRVVTQGIDAAGHLQNVVFDNWNGQHVGYTYASNFTYTPAGAQAEVNYGNGVYIHTPYNNRQQMCQVWSSNSTQVLIDTHIYFGGSTTFCNDTPGNNGNVTQIKDWRNPANTRYFGYDSLNRITSFSNGDNSVQQSYGYDSFGNLTQSGTLNFQVGYDQNNRINSGGFNYDAAGNIIGTNVAGINSTYSFDGAGRMFNVNSGAAYYTYDGNGNRMRKDISGSWTEYQYLNGQVIAEKHSDGTWSDYIYANGQKIARADSYNRYIQFAGSFSSTGNYGEFNLSPASSHLDGQYVIQSGDKLMWKQLQSQAYGGIYFFTTDGSNGAWTLTDQNGEYGNDSMQTDGAWHTRVVDLSAFAGKTVSSVNLVAEGNSPAGSWTMQYSDIAVVAASGAVVPIYNGASAVAGYPWGTSGYSFGGTNVQTVPSATGDTVYYTGDQIGSARMLTSGGGWPTSTSTFYPFGQEQPAATDPNPYRYTGLERDGETGLDHATFRQFSSIQGRWLSPDPYMGSYDLTDPQTFNRYAYVLNNPPSLFDPLGLKPGDPLPPVNGIPTIEGAPLIGCGFSCYGWDIGGSGSGHLEPMLPIPDDGSGGGGYIAPYMALSVVMLPAPKSCTDQLADMLNDINSVKGGRPPFGTKGLAQRFAQILKGRTTDANHVSQFQQRQTNLQRKIDDYRKDCGEPPPAVTAWANMPLASPWTPPNLQNFSVPSWVGPAAVTGAAACAILMPGCLEVEAGAALVF